jgi:hypothetical protein
MKPLKFLGLEYDGKLDKLRAKTRKGSTLEYDKQDLLKALIEREKAEKKGRDFSYVEGAGESIQDSWVQFIKNSVMGFIQSRLYSGS